jgi:sortase A
MNHVELDDRVIPWSVVFIIIGAVILMTVCIIWAIVPTAMPQPIYDLVMQTAPKPIIQMIPTRADIAVMPMPQSDALLPDSRVPITATVSVTTAVSPRAPLQITIPAIELDAPIVPISTTAVVYNGQTYQQWSVPAGFVAGWHQNSATIGTNGNLVLNGHHNINGEVFRDLVDLKVGDELTLADDGGLHHYKISDKEILAERGQPIAVRIKNAEWIAPTDDERVTLITCWPYTDNSHRLIIVAKPIQIIKYH